MQISAQSSILRPAHKPRLTLVTIAKPKTLKYKPLYSCSKELIDAVSSYTYSHSNADINAIMSSMTDTQCEVVKDLIVTLWVYEINRFFAFVVAFIVLIIFLVFK